MSKKKIYKSEDKKFRYLEIENYGDVERGEKRYELETFGTGGYSAGEDTFSLNSFDDEVAKGASTVIGGTGQDSVRERIMELEKQKLEEEKAEAEQKQNAPKKPQSDDGFKPMVEEGSEGEEPEEEEKPAMDEEELKKLLEAEYKKGFDEGHRKGYDEASGSAQREYEKQKKDYIDMLKSCYSEVGEQAKVFADAVEELDSVLPDMIVGFVKELIGFERKANDKLAVSVIRKTLDKLSDLENVVFKVNPEDLEAVRSELPAFDSEADPSVEQGGVRISTNIGEMDYTIETMLENFEKRIYEELNSSEQDQ
ncbi:FliH/SctL family protein [Limisalsivibrio acetivorans]|uniref:FliH/SctL family protein n=1 Tax=Limisalsivibrio acetivorans TaxID=1304888 RepID=UPI0003B339DD|nr:FliH/SctL family protein [Limisalsivibrio acetivorans]